MFQNYFKLAFRHLWKNKSLSLLNIAGLAVGLACAGLIMLWAEDEITYNTFHQKGERIFQVLENQVFEGQLYTFAATPGLLSGAMQQELPEVAQSTRMSWGETYAFSFGDKSSFEQGFLVDSSFLDIFSFPWVAGNPVTALQKPHSLVVTERMGEKFFGAESPLGKTIKINNKDEFKITGVIKNPPSNSSLRFEWLGSFHLFQQQNSWWNDWHTNGMQTFVLLNSAADSVAVNRKLQTFIQNKAEGASAHPFLFPLPDWHLRSEIKEGKLTGNGRIEYLRLFSIIAAFILLIACFNYMNLTTARSENRRREVGVRKVVGAGKGLLAGQFMGEALLTSLFSTGLAALLIVVVLPQFNALVDKQLTLQWNDPLHMGVLLGVALSSGVLAGLYPSFYLSSFRPLAVLKGMVAVPTRKNKLGDTVSIRKGLVVMQFCVSVFLIFCTIVVYRQISHVKNRHLGYDKNAVVYLRSTQQIDDKFSLIRQELLANNAVENVAKSSDGVMNMGSSSASFHWEGKAPNADKLVAMSWVSPEYIKTLGMTVSSGRDFHANPDLDSNAVIINETFAKLIRKDAGKEDLIGSVIREGEGEESNALRVVGVIEDFRFGDMYTDLQPLILFCARPTNGVVLIKLKPDQAIPTALASIGETFKTHNPGFPFDYKFLDQEFDKLFRSETTVGKLSLIFAAIAIFICCLGLFGLAAFAAERRTKEIGIRKVLGASVVGITALLAKDFLKLVLIAILIASPLAWYFMNQWLADFTYRIEVQWWMFALAGVLAIGIAFLTIGFQSVRAALTNPVKSLRSE